MTGCTARRYDQFETSPEAIEQELRPAVCERRQIDLRQIIVSISHAISTFHNAFYDQMLSGKI